MENLIHGPQTGAYSTVICNSDDIAIANLARVLGKGAAENPFLCHMFYQDAAGDGRTEMALNALNAVSKYELGSFSRDIAGSVMRTLMPPDTFDIRKDCWCGPDGFSISEGKGRLEGGKQDYLGSHNYDHVKICFDFEDITIATTSVDQVLRARLRAQRDSYGDCYEVSLQRDGVLHIMATSLSNGEQMSVAQIATGLADIQGTAHHMEILIKDEADGDVKISALFDTNGTANDKTLVWTHAASDTVYKRFEKGSVGVYSAGSINLIDNFIIKDGRLFP
jgi:hypothetical protein